MKIGSNGPMRALHVLVIDDSAVVRQLMTSLLSQVANVTVAVASNPIIAMDKMKQRRPDVILLDLEMPCMDGLTFLRKIMTEDPIPVVVCSGLAAPGSEAALRALEEGAVEIIAKPKLGIRDFLQDTAVVIKETILAAANARVRRNLKLQLPQPDSNAAELEFKRDRSLLRLTTDKVVTIGASTGGTEAIREILEAMPPDAPGLVIVQHMPEYFTKAFAQRLNQCCRLEVKEAVHGDRVKAGRALIAPGNRHIQLKQSGAHYIVELMDGPPISRHRPSVDVLFCSAAQAVGPNAVGVILTGMGNDGAAGLLAMKQTGAATIAQDESSCVVFGMPKEAISAGAVDEVVTLKKITRRILMKAQYI